MELQASSTCMENLFSRFDAIFSLFVDEHKKAQKVP